MGNVWWVILVKQDCFTKNNTEIVLTKLEELFDMKRTYTRSPFCSNQFAYYLHSAQTPSFVLRYPLYKDRRERWPMCQQPSPIWDI